MKTTAPYGTWPAQLSAQAVASGNPRLAETRINEQRVFWLEGRAQEQGRNAIVMCEFEGTPKDVLPAPWSARSKVHEYGGGAYAVDGDNIYFVNGACQQIYHLSISTGAISELTNTPNVRYAGLVLDAKHQQLLAICEDHSKNHHEPSNSLVAIPLHTTSLQPQTLACGHDFYAHIALSPCANKVAFVTWDHPNMPWDETTLWVAELPSSGEHTPLTHIQAIPMEPSCSVFQPQWLNSTQLTFIADTQQWWNIQKVDINTQQITQLHTLEAEFATPLWTLNMSTYGQLNNNQLFTAYTQNNQWQCALLHLNSQQKESNTNTFTPIKTPFNAISDVHTEGNSAAFIAASAHASPAVWLWHNNTLRQITQQTTTINNNNTSLGVPFEFPTSHNATSYANFYPPTNPLFCAPEADLPPAIFIGHGGPTGQTDLGYNAKIQFWTQRGFAVVDVNYRGSTGYGRTYRNALKGQWGIYDVDDLCHAAEYVTQQGWVHPNKRIVRGSSAGGYSVLAALTNSNTFNAGVSLYGIGDLETLATDTHKFEARYLDSLVGPYPQEKQTYVERSPIHKAHHIQCPLLVFQGLDDKVVPPNQAQDMVDAVKKQGLPVVYVTYPGEGHGFRKAETVINQLETELAFYKDIFDFTGEAPS